MTKLRDMVRDDVAIQQSMIFPDTHLRGSISTHFKPANC